MDATNFITSLQDCLAVDIVLNSSVLVEPNPDSKCNAITLKFSGKNILLKTDWSSETRADFFSFLNKTHSITDYCVITRKRIYVCELKSSNCNGIEKQFLNTGLFITFLKEYVKINYNYDVSDIEVIFLVFKNCVKQNFGRKLPPIKGQRVNYYVLSCGTEHNLDMYEYAA